MRRRVAGVCERLAVDRRRPGHRCDELLAVRAVDDEVVVDRQVAEPERRAGAGRPDGER